MNTFIDTDSQKKVESEQSQELIHVPEIDDDFTAEYDDEQFYDCKLMDYILMDYN